MSSIGVQDTGQVVVLNGAPRSGKSSIAAAIQESFQGVWMNLGVDNYMATTPPHLQPGIGLRPGGENVEVEEWIPIMYAALYESVAANARLGLNVVMDVDHHDAYSKPLGILKDCARRLSGLPVLFVGVRCPIEVIWQRREKTWGQIRGSVDESESASVEQWQTAVHDHGGYDIEVDTSVMSPAECAALIGERLRYGPAGSAFARLAELASRS